MALVNFDDLMLCDITTGFYQFTPGSIDFALDIDHKYYIP